MPARLNAVRTGKHLLKPDKYKQVIIDSLRYLTSNKQVSLYAFVIMSNHIHLIWQAMPGKTPTQIQHSFMKYTAQQIKFDLVKSHPAVLEKFRVNARDRTYLPIAIGIGKEILWVLS
jgi:putative transposase